MESESGIMTKISDSGYSNSCSNSNSQRSASSKSRHSGSNSSRSSGYCGAPTDGGADVGPPSPSKRTKEKDHKKKKLKSGSAANFDGQNLMETPVVEVTAPSNEETSIDTSAEVVGEETTHKGEDKDVTEENVVLESLVEDALPKLVCSESKDEELDVQFTSVPCDTLIDTENKASPQNKDGFWCVISMYDGVVWYTTPNLTSILGFPKDMWLGRSFIDFVHPKDREIFSNQITNGIVLPLVDSSGKSRDVKNTMFVCLRKYRGLKTSGFGVIEKAVSYEAFQLTVTFKNIAGSSEAKQIDSNAGMFLIVVAVPVHSSYKVPDETRKSAKFSMRHTAACTFSHVDPDVVKNFGFLPQDMLGKSVFDFYHPEDLPFLKEVYESVLRMCQIAGSVFRSKPYRFAVQNGGFAMIETEWSSFVNPWSRRLEFVIGLHRVLQGPHNPNIFEAPKDDESKLISEEVLKESKIIQEEILLLLNKELTRSEAVKHEVSKRCKDLAAFMETLMDEVSKTKLKLDLPQENDPTISDRDSVMLGEISPHHDYCDSKSSSETPPSYNQLNYNENIQRFFQSKPKTIGSDGSGANQSAIDTDQEAKSVSAGQECANNQKCLSPVQNSGDSGSGSAGNLSSGSNANIESGTTSATNTSNDSYKPPHLTEALLVRHNEDMEKLMVKRHRDQRSNIKAENKKSHSKVEKVTSLKVGDKNDSAANRVHSIKRSVSQSWEGDSHKVSKYSHQYNQNQNAANSNKSAVQTPVSTSSDTIYKSGINDVNLWPPFSVTMTPINNTHPCGITTTPNTSGTFATSMFPVYYIPTQQKTSDFGDSSLSSNFQVQYMSGMVYNYNTIFPASPFFCSPVPVLPVPVTQQVITSAEPFNNMRNYSAPAEHKPNPPSNGNAVPQFQRPASQATSVKAEPGSAMGSIASASVANNALSECSRKGVGLQSVCSPDSPLVSPPDGDISMDNYNMPAKTTDNDSNKYRGSQTNDEESSYSSFYSSFLKTDTGSGSNDDCDKANRSDDNSWKAYFPLRKSDPPWLQSVSITPDLVYRYQMSLNEIGDILQSDLNTLKEVSQPMLVNDQLNQLYIEMELEGLSTRLTLEEGITSSSDDDNHSLLNRPRKKRHSYSSLMMIYEENAPFPPPPHK